MRRCFKNLQRKINALIISLLSYHGRWRHKHRSTKQPSAFINKKKLACRSKKVLSDVTRVTHATSKHHDREQCARLIRTASSARRREKKKNRHSSRLRLSFASPTIMRRPHTEGRLYILLHANIDYYAQNTYIGSYKYACNQAATSGTRARRNEQISIEITPCWHFLGVLRACVLDRATINNKERQNQSRDLLADAGWNCTRPTNINN